MVPKLKVVEVLPGSSGGICAVPAEMLMAKVVVGVERGGQGHQGCDSLDRSDGECES